MTISTIDHSQRTAAKVAGVISLVVMAIFEMVLGFWLLIKGIGMVPAHPIS